MNNAIFGKTMEDLRWRVDVNLTNTEKQFQKYVNRVFFKRFEIFNEDLVIMCDFHYNHIKK